MTRKAGTRSLTRLLIASVLLAGLATAVGCQAYREGGSRTAGQVTDDLAIQTSVKSRLLANSELSAWRIQTEVYEGIVTLNGRVPSESARAEAIRIAAEVRGVVRVEDRLTIVTE